MKVFGLGLARTGTTSMHEAMLLLGLRSAPSSAHLIDGLDEAFLDRFDAFFDNPIPFLRSELAGRFPDARFIITWRPVDEWIASMRWLFGPGLDRLDPATRQLGDRVHRSVYGTDVFDEAVLTAVHDAHYRDLRTWAAGRPNVVWIGAASQALVNPAAVTGPSIEVVPFGWPPLCEFLGRPEPSVEFPHANSRPKERWRKRGGSASLP